jgi:DNA-binding CsgD family transcriptional regulator
MLPDTPEILGKYSYQHPLVTHIVRTKDSTPRRITDFVSQRQFRTTALFNELFHPLRIPYTMGLGLGLAPHSQWPVALACHRSGRDFTADELAIADVLSPHIVQAFGNAATVTKMQEELSTLSRTIEEMNRAVLALTPQGCIQWATPRAHRLLTDYGLQGNRRSDWLPPRLREWVGQQLAKLGSPSDLPFPLDPLVITREDRTLTVRFIQDGAKRLLFLDETRVSFPLDSLATLGLSRRETEILGWVAHGKTNLEIGMILGISHRTVQKHLEHVYGRLGVENRYAAMTMALDVMRRGIFRTNGD